VGQDQVEIDQTGQAPSLWREQRLMESFDVDILGRLRPQNLLAYLLNSAWNHANGTSYGFEELSERNLMWVLIKIQLAVKRQPKWGEQITIETWGKRIERLYALRDFACISASGEKLISATSSWMILDRTSGRPQRFDQTTDHFAWQPEREEIETDLAKVQATSTGREIARFRVLFSDMDVNRHVNSAKYLQWMVDAHSQEHLEANEPESIELSFLSEAMPNDEVAVFSGKSGDHELCSVRRTRGGEELCRARFKWRASR
jgi:medium-chain acyl-[acyl-carrier-protein] hydrolase